MPKRIPKTLLTAVLPGWGLVTGPTLASTVTGKDAEGYIVLPNTDKSVFIHIPWDNAKLGKAARYYIPGAMEVYWNQPGATYDPVKNRWSHLKVCSHVGRNEVKFPSSWEQHYVGTTRTGWSVWYNVPAYKVKRQVERFGVTDPTELKKHNSV